MRKIKGKHAENERKNKRNIRCKKRKMRGEREENERTTGGKCEEKRNTS